MKDVLLRNALGLAGFAALTVGLVAGTRELTAERIAENQLQVQLAALARVLPDALHDAPLTEHPVVVPGESVGRTGDVTVFRAVRDGAVTAVAVPTRAPDGYSGAIDLVVGVTREGLVTAVEVTDHRETPGLGDRIERRKSDWITAFAGRSLSDPETAGWAVRKDGGAFDALTGATITPRAVIDAVRRTLEYAAAQKETLFAPPATATVAALDRAAGNTP